MYLLLDGDIYPQYLTCAKTRYVNFNQKLDLEIFEPLQSTLIMGTLLNYVLIAQKIDGKVLVQKKTKFLANKIIEVFCRSVDEYRTSMKFVCKNEIKFYLQK